MCMAHDKATLAVGGVALVVVGLDDSPLIEGYRVIGL